MENLEQPLSMDAGSNEMFGKFKDAESLLKAYNNLESEFTKKSQKLKILESENQARSEQENRIQDVEKKVDEFVTKFSLAKPFSSALKESLLAGQSLEETAMTLMQNNYKRAEDYACDGEFLNNYIYSNPQIKDKIVKDYLSKITRNSPIKIENGASNIPLTPPRIPKTISEAGQMAKTIIKQR